MKPAALLLAVLSLSIPSSLAAAEESADRLVVAILSHPTAPTAREPGLPVKSADPCGNPEIQPNSNTPTWDTQASTTPCGALETDNLLTRQPVASGVYQEALTTTAKYGLTPRLEVRWVLPGRMFQSGGGTSSLGGATDQWLGALFRFRDQGRRSPDLAIDYGLKLPTANPAKGFGSGFTDHQLTLIASRDLGSNHVDMNAVLLVAGAPHGRDAATQFGTALTHSFSPRLIGTVEAFGGSQPATTQRYGAVLMGGAWGLRPALSFNAGVLNAFTGGTPHRQYLAGFVYTIKPGFAPPGSSRWTRLLGR